MIARSGKRSVERAAPEQEDADLMRQLATGQLGALGSLYDRHHAPVRSFIARVTGDAHDVDDWVHATFLAAAQGASRYDGRASCRPWLIGIAAQLLRGRRRSLSRFLGVLTSFKSTLPSLHDPRPRLLARGDVERALAGLTEVKRLTVLMAEVEGFSCDEIARALGVPVGTVWTRLHAARRELRQALELERDVDAKAAR
jgi:RNA polymerase sigma-70 factor, ECF subfamily